MKSWFVFILLVNLFYVGSQLAADTVEHNDREDDPVVTSARSAGPGVATPTADILTTKRFNLDLSSNRMFPFPEKVGRTLTKAQSKEVHDHAVNIVSVPSPRENRNNVY